MNNPPIPPSGQPGPDPNDILHFPAPEPEPPAPIDQQDRTKNSPAYRTPLKIKGGDQILATWISTRIEELRMEMGLTTTNQVTIDSFMWIRQRNQAWYYNDLEWRKRLSPLFEKSNFTLGTCMRHSRYVGARVMDDLLGTNPFFAALGVNVNDQQRAKDVERYVQGKIDEGTIRAKLREAQQNAIFTDDQIVKTHYVRNASPFIGPATVYVGPDNAPIRSPELGLMIYEDARFMPSLSVEGVEVFEDDPSLRCLPAQDGSPDRTMLGPDMKPAGEIRLMAFEDLPQEEIKFEGVEMSLVPFNGFLCPLRVESIEKADACFELYMESPNVLRERFGGVTVGQEYFTFWDAPGVKQAKYAFGENDYAPSQLEKMVYCAECYITHDFDGDGRDEEIFAVFDVRHSKLIFYDYLYNRMPRRPYDVIPGVERVANRWYGRGIISLTFPITMAIDAHLNRENAKDAKEGSVTFYDEQGCEEWANGERPVIGSMDIYKLRPGWGKDKPPIIRVNLDEDIKISEKLRADLTQAEDLAIGSISGRDASESGMDRSNTATGIVDLRQDSDVITKAIEVCQTEAIESALELAVDLMLERMPKSAVIQNGMGSLVQISRSDARTLRRSVRLLLTRSRSTQMQQVALAAIPQFKDYWNLFLTNPPMAKAGRDLYISELKGLEINDPDSYLPEVTDQMIAAYQAQQGQPQKPVPTVGITFTAPLPTMPPAVQQAVLSDAGINVDPATLTQTTPPQPGAPPLALPPSRAVTPAPSAPPMNGNGH